MSREEKREKLEKQRKANAERVKKSRYVGYIYASLDYIYRDLVARSENF